MGKIEKSIVIKAPPEKVWEMLALDRLPEWEEGWKGNLKGVEYTSEVRTPEDKYRVGATAHGIPKKQGKSIKLNFEIIESLENKKITYRFLYLKARVHATYILEPVEEETKFTYVLDYEFPYSIFGKIIDKLFFQRTTHKLMEKSLKKLKSTLEK